MTTTAMHPTPCLVNHSSPNVQSVAPGVWRTLARAAARVLDLAGEHQNSWRQTQTPSAMDAHLLRDIGAPDWLHQRAQLRQAQDCRERYEAVSRFRY